MQEQSKRLIELRENANKVFQEALSDYKLQNPFVKKSPDGPLYQDDVIVISNEDHSVLFKKSNSTILKPLPNYGVWTEIDWSSDSFNWLVDAIFNANAIQIDGKGSERKVVAVKDCSWKSGDFRGGQFIRGTFEGGTFIGEFGPGAKWLTSPFSFIDGKTHETESILGMANITNLSKTKFSFNVITVPPGHDITIKLQSGVIHVISVLKRLDSKSNIFSYKVTNGVSKETKPVNIRWGQLRGQNKTEFNSNTVFATTAIPDMFTNIFGLSFDSPVNSVLVDISTSFETPQWSQQEKTPKELATSQFSFDLSKNPIFKLNQILRKRPTSNNPGEIFFNFPTAEDQRGFDSVVEFIKNGWIDAYAKKVKNALENGIVTGAPSNMPYLAALIGKQDGISADTIGKDTYNSLLGLDNFLKYFVNNMVIRTKKGGPQRGVSDIEDAAGKQALKDGLLTAIGKAPAVETKPQPVTKTSKIDKGRRLKLPENQQVRDIVQKILSENMKHF